MTDYQDQVISDICDELKKAEKIHPSWPDNLFEGLAIIGEEFGELQQAALQSKYEGAGQNKIYKEGLHVAAMAIRFMLNTDKTLCKGSNNIKVLEPGND